MSKMMLIGMFVMGLSMGTSAVVSAQGNGYTPEMGRCISSCESMGHSSAYCWQCCVQRQCPAE